MTRFKTRANCADSPLECGAVRRCFERRPRADRVDAGDQRPASGDDASGVAPSSNAWRQQLLRRDKITCLVDDADAMKRDEWCGRPACVARVHARIDGAACASEPPLGRKPLRLLRRRRQRDVTGCPAPPGSIGVPSNIAPPRRRDPLERVCARCREWRCSRTCAFDRARMEQCESRAPCVAGRVDRRGRRAARGAADSTAARDRSRAGSGDAG